MRNLLLFLGLIVQIHVAGNNVAVPQQMYLQKTLTSDYGFVTVPQQTCLQKTLTSNYWGKIAYSDNRYSYAMNNPLKYTDASGEFFFIPIILAAVVNTAIQGFSGHLGGMGSFWKSMGIGALSGAVGYGAGTLANGALGTATTLGSSIFNGATIGASGGFAGGFVSGAGNAWANGTNFDQGLKSGLISGGWGALSGAVIGGITGGIQYNKQMGIFHRGNDVLGVDGDDDAVPATDAFLKQAQGVWYPDAPMDNADAFTTENLSKDAITHFNENPDADAITIPQSAKGLLTGRSDMYFASKAFSSSKQLFFTMGHEFIHVSQFIALTGESVNLINKPLFRGMLEFIAYSYQNSIGGGTGMNSFRGSMKDMMTTYGDYFKKLNYFNYGWINTVNYKYPF